MTDGGNKKDNSTRKGKVAKRVELDSSVEFDGFDDFEEK